ncbi:hypothetical protein ACKX2L_09180 [Lachnospiraceae bacterium YH-ros2228]
MKVSIPENSLIACMCEGGAEIAIMDILLDNRLLIFKREQLLEERLIPRISAKDFEKRYLRVAYGQKIVILRVIDSRSEKFNLSKAYQCQVDLINVITAPEIEMLIIASENKLESFSHSDLKKPSEYCKIVLKMKNVKQPSFVKNYFHNPEDLINGIQKYHQLHRQLKTEASIYDLIDWTAIKSLQSDNQVD